MYCKIKQLKYFLHLYRGINQEISSKGTEHRTDPSQSK